MKSPAFALGAGGCGCSSCSHTAEFIGKGFAAWPKGNPAGRRSAAAYAGHVAHGKSGGVDRLIPAFKVGGAPQFSRSGLAPPLPEPSALVRDWIASSYAWAEKKTAPEGAASPANPGKDRQHLPAGDRPSGPDCDSTGGTATIIAMGKSARGRGRPAVPGRFVVVKLEEHLIRKAEKLGAAALGGKDHGKLAAGIRAALEKIKTAA